MTTRGYATERKVTVRFLLALVLLIFCFAGTARAEENWPQDIRPVPESDLTGKLVILHSNDVHGAIEGYAKMTALRDAYEKLGAEVILADAGDFSQGDPYVNFSSGADAIAMMNAAGYTVATLGNHEFDYGFEQLMGNLEKAEFPLICANVWESGKPILEPHYLYTAASGVKVGFLGLDTEESKTKTNPAKTIGITFYGGSDMDRIAEEQTEELRKEGADLVIALTHLGVSEESAPGKNRSLDLWKDTSGIDLLIDGHSHTVMTGGTNGEVIQSTGTKFQYIGVVVVSEDGKLEDHYLVETEKIAAEENSPAEAEAKKIEARVDSEFAEKVCISELEFEGDKSVNRMQETNNGDLITDALLWQIGKDPAALKVPADHVLAIMNGGTIRDRIPKGDVTRKDINTVYPFGNTLTVTYLTGEELLEALEASTFCTPEPVGGFPQVGGIEWSLDTTKPFDQGTQYPASTYYSPASIRRVTIRSVNGKPFRPEDTYAVGATDFVSAGGDTYFVFATKEGYDTGLLVDEILVSYIQEELGGVLTAEKYGKLRGNFELITESTESTDAGKAADAGSAGKTSSEVKAAETVSGPAEAAAAGGEYEVKKGDCLWDIAERVYGDGRKWRKIYENNRQIIRRPGIIRPGQILKLPDAA